MKTQTTSPWQYMLLSGLSCLLPRTTQAIARGANTGSGHRSTGQDKEFVIDHGGVPRGTNQYRDAGYQDVSCTDLQPDCWQRAMHQGCILDFINMQNDCARTCLLCDNQVQDKVFALYNAEAQDIPKDGNLIEATLDVIDETQEYMVGLYQDPDLDAESVATCQNRRARCSLWSAMGECENNPTFMAKYCPPACETCAEVLFENRCPVDQELLETSVWGPGDLDEMFQRIVSDPQWQAYNLQILSQPDPKTDNILEGPWVITLDDFLTAEECETLIRLGAEQVYERSEDLSDTMNPDGTFDGYVSKDRTSTNAWCDGPCMEHPMTQAVHVRMEKLIEIPIPNYEDLQLLRYEEGQKYGIHHDFIPSQVERQAGARILTVFLYLNDVEAGGGTNFPALDLTIMPKRGRALLWPSVLDEDPDEPDERTEHQALPVERGMKYGANTWVHSRNFKDAAENNCH